MNCCFGQEFRIDIYFMGKYPDFGNNLYEWFVPRLNPIYNNQRAHLAR